MKNPLAILIFSAIVIGIFIAIYRYNTKDNSGTGTLLGRTNQNPVGLCYSACISRPGSTDKGCNELCDWLRAKSTVGTDCMTACFKEGSDRTVCSQQCQTQLRQQNEESGCEKLARACGDDTACWESWFKTCGGAKEIIPTITPYTYFVPFTTRDNGSSGGGRGGQTFQG